MPDVTPADIWNLFMEKLSDKWRREFVPAIPAGYSKLKSTSSAVTSSEDDRLFRKYLAESVNGAVAVIIENATARKIPVSQFEPPKKKTNSPTSSSEISYNSHMGEHKDSRMTEMPLSKIPGNRHANERKDNRGNRIEPILLKPSISFWMKAVPGLIADRKSVV